MYPRKDRHRVRSCLLVSIVLCLSFCQTESLNGFIRTYTDRSAGNDSVLQRLTLDHDSGDIFVAGRNVLYRLDGDLNVRRWTSLGPVCEETGESSARCSKTSDNDASLLLPFPEGDRRLLSCGTSEHGLCSVVDTRDLSGRPMLPGSPLSHLGGDNSVVALFAKGGSTSSGHDTPILYVAHACDARPSSLSPPVFAALKLETVSGTSFAVYKHVIDSLGIRSAIELDDEWRRSTFRFQFVYNFEHGDFVYFVTVQRKNRSISSPYVTKLARVCRGDFGFYSYTEIELG